MRKLSMRIRVTILNVLLLTVCCVGLTFTLNLSANKMANKLDNAFAMQKRFSQSAAHELRTPLTVLRTKIDVFRKKEDRTHEEYTKLIDVFSANTNRLSDLVKDLLSLTNILEVDLDDEIVLTRVFEEIIKEVTPLLSDKNITLSLYNNTNKIILNGNKNLLYRAFYNIVENAIKYNFDNGSVEISLDVQEGKNIVSIKDSGMSIPNEVKNLIFEPFFRMDKSRNRKIAGSGLGLSTACTIIEKHKGEIVVLDNPSGGSIFKITL